MCYKLHLFMERSEKLFLYIIDIMNKSYDTSSINHIDKTTTSHYAFNDVSKQ